MIDFHLFNFTPSLNKNFLALCVSRAFSLLLESMAIKITSLHIINFLQNSAINYLPSNLVTSSPQQLKWLHKLEKVESPLPTTATHQPVEGERMDGGGGDGHNSDIDVFLPMGFSMRSRRGPPTTSNTFSTGMHPGIYVSRIFWSKTACCQSSIR